MAKEIVPQTPEELADAIADGKVLKNPDDLKRFENAYRQKMLSDESFKAQLDEKIQAGMAGFMRDNGVSSPVAHGVAVKASQAVSRGKGAVYNKAASGGKYEAQVEPENRYESLAEFMQSVSPQARTYRNRAELSRKLGRLFEIQNSFGEEVPADGGFLVPETLRADLLQYALENAVVRPRATVIPMSTLRVPIPTIDDTSHTTSVFGGVTVYWTEESGSLTESQASFGRAVLEARKLTAYAEIPNELLADAVAFGSFFDQKFPQALAFFEDYAFINGSGSGEPMGYINGEGAVTQSGQAGQTTKTIVWENVVNMYSRMMPVALNNAVWICSPDTLPQIFTMSLSVGTGGSPVMVGNYPGLSGADAPRMSLLGHPLIVSEKVPALGTAGCLSFVNFDFYLIGDRQTMQVNSSDQYKFANDKTAFRVIERVDGQPWLRSAVTPANNSSNTLSPYVLLAGI